MTERDPKVSARYRELGAEEPPRHLDDAILAASRRSVQKRSWNRPIAIAAVIVLAVAVTVHVQRDQPAEELVTAARVPPPPVAATAPQVAPEAKQPERAAPAPAPRFTPDPKPQAAPAEERAVAAPPAATATDQLAMRRSAPQRDAVAEAGKREEAQAFQGAAGAVQAQRAPATASAMRRMDDARVSPALSKFAAHSPEQWLLAIDDLKRQGWHDEAARELAEFRKRYPDYRIPEAITERFETR
jgi:hypothetical protein